MINIFQQLLNGCALGGLYVCIAVGITLIYSVLRIIHLAHGVALIIGAYSTLLFLPFFGGNYILSTAMGMLIAAGVGTVIGLGGYVPLIKKKNYVATLLISLSILVAFQEFFIIAFGSAIKTFPQPLNSITVNIGGFTIFAVQGLAVIVGLASMLFLWLFLIKTNMGRGLRAIDQDQNLAQICGVNPIMVYAIAFVIAGLLG